VNPSARTWVQRGLVVALWVIAFLLWRNYQTSNDLTTIQAGQRFIDSIDEAWWGIFAFVGVYLVRPLVLFPASLLTIMAGVLFGPWLGVFVVILAANTSAMIAFGIGGILGGPPGVDTEEANDSAPTERSFVAKWSQRLRDNSFETVFTMRLLFLPYDLVNYLCGAVHIRWTSFLLATALGSLPGTISFVLLGSSLERVDMGLDGLNPWAIVAGVALFIISVSISRIVRKRQA
jgi:uncharacterized membrane protein YdjX (TVP38/TMEM64 family)